MTTLRENRSLLCKAHPRMVTTEEGAVLGTEPPLLVLLEQAIATGSERGAGGGSSDKRERSPVDLTAMTLFQDISRTVNLGWPLAGEIGWLRWPLAVKVEHWCAVAEGTSIEPDLALRLANWTAQIRELLEPTHKSPLRGVHCINCKKVHHRKEETDGSHTVMPALLAHLSEDPTWVECLACGETWLGGELLDLRAQQGRMR